MRWSSTPFPYKIESSRHWITEIHHFAVTGASTKDEEVEGQTWNIPPWAKKGDKYPSSELIKCAVFIINYEDVHNELTFKEGIIIIRY